MSADFPVTIAELRAFFGGTGRACGLKKSEWLIIDDRLKKLDALIAEVEYAITTIDGDPSLADLLTDAVARAKGEIE